MSRPTEEDRNRQAFGQRLASLRQKRNLTQSQLATKTGLALDTIGALEQGRRWARITTLHKLAKGLGTTTDDLFKGLK